MQCSAVDRMLTRIPIEMHSVCTRAASDLLPLICESKPPPLTDRYTLCFAREGPYLKLAVSRNCLRAPLDGIHSNFQSSSIGAEPRQGLSIDRHRLSVVQIYNLIDRMVVQYIILMMSIGQWQKCSTVLIGLLLRIWKLSYIPVLNVRLLLFRCHSETMLSLQWDDYGASSFFSTYCCCCLE